VTAIHLLPVICKDVPDGTGEDHKSCGSVEDSREFLYSFDVAEDLLSRMAGVADSCNSGRPEASNAFLVRMQLSSAVPVPAARSNAQSLFMERENRLRNQGGVVEGVS